MKTLIQFTALTTLMVAMSFNLSAASPNFELEEEAYIDDIPFNTEVVVANYLYNEALNVTFKFEEEAYIDDIPFDTQAIVEASHLNETLNVVLNLIK